MAELIKNARISSELVYLGRPDSASHPEHDSIVHPELFHKTQENLQQEREEAYQSGYLCGIEEAQSLAEQQMADVKQQMEQLLLSIPMAITQNRLQSSTEIADIVLHITEQLFIEQQSNPKAIAKQINQILKQVSSQQAIELCLHPMDISALQKGLIQLDTTHLSGLKIKSDESLHLGGCRINTEHGIFDASIEKQIEQLKSLLVQIKQRGKHASMD